jgi:hypothetical protein
MGRFIRIEPKGVAATSAARPTGITTENSEPAIATLADAAITAPPTATTPDADVKCVA